MPEKKTKPKQAQTNFQYAQQRNNKQKRQRAVLLLWLQRGELLATLNAQKLFRFFHLLAHKYLKKEDPSIRTQFYQKCTPLFR